MSKIIQLSEDTIEKIAAGEVINRPESIIKEAVENSIDANSKNILIEIKSGGKDYIRITDNGVGIYPDDLELAFKKHCTSKITNFDDIYNLNSCGFRGEALNSIANVSKATIISKAINSNEAYQIEYKYGEKVSKSQSVSNTGTTLIVESLFDNMPVRKKLLASDRTEENKIRSLIERFSIGYPNIAFKLISNSRLIINTSGSGDLKKAIFEVYGNSIVKDLIEIKSDKIYGFISNSHLFSNNNTTEMFFINNRIVYNEELNKAVESQYFGKIPNNKKPFFFIFLDVNKNDIDVNIHPAKKYVKIIFAEDIINNIKTIVSNALNSDDEFVFIEENDNSIIDFKIYTDTDDIQKINDNIIVADNNEYNNYTAENKSNNDSTINTGYIQNELNIKIPNLVVEESDENYMHESKYNFDLIFPDSKIGSFNNIIGVIFRNYLLIENRPNNLILIADLRLATARNLYDLYTKDIVEHNVPIQSLLEPIIYEFDSYDSDTITNNLDTLISIGFDITAITKNKFVLRGIPMFISDYFKRDDFYDIVSEIEITKKNIIPNITQRVSLIAANSEPFFNNISSVNIIEQLLSSSNPQLAPNGRQIFQILTENEFLKRFNYE